MKQDLAETKPSIWNLVNCKCPRCRRGDMFADNNPYHLKRTMKMNPVCKVCGQPFDIETGFYFGSSYVSYALTVAISVASLIAFWVFIGLSLKDNRFFYWMAGNALLLICLQPWVMRVARSLWLAIFVRYNPAWKTEGPQQVERMNKTYQNAW